MADRGHAFETILWTDRARLPLVEAVLARMAGAIKPIGIGGPGQSELKDVAAHLDCPFDDDLRRLAIDRPASFLLLASLERVNIESLAAAVAQGTIVLTVEPIAGEFGEIQLLRQHRLTSESAQSGSGRIIHVPSFMRSQGWLSAADPQSVLGAARSLAIIASSSADGCSLFARLHEAWRTVLALAPLPESIDCAVAVPTRDLPANVRELAGSLTAHARLPEGGAVVQVSEAAGGGADKPPSSGGDPASPIFACERMLEITGEHGRLRVSDRDYRLYDKGGRLIDAHEPAPAEPPHTLASAVADHWMQLIDRPSLMTERTGESETREAAALACCLACLLSARTGQPESPDRLMSAHGRR